MMNMSHLAAKEWIIKLTLLSINKYLSAPFSDQQVNLLIGFQVGYSLETVTTLQCSLKINAVLKLDCTSLVQPENNFFKSLSTEE